MENQGIPPTPTEPQAEPQPQTLPSLNPAIGPLVPEPLAVSASSVLEPPNLPKKKSKKRIFIILFLALILILLFGGSALAYAVAYDKVDIKNPEVKKVVTGFVMSLPFTPKTPEYLFYRMGDSYKDVNNFSFDAIASVSGESPMFSALSEGKLEIKMDGKVVFADENRLDTEFAIHLPYDINLEGRTVAKNGYFKLSRPSDEILNALGFDPVSLDSSFDKWISFDFSSYGDESKKLLDSVNTKDNDNEKFLNWVRQMQVMEETVDGERVYKISADWNKEELQEILSLFEKDVDTLKMANLSVNFWLNKKDFLVRKIQVNFETSPRDKGETILEEVLSSSYKGSFIVNFTGFNIDANIEPPQEALPFEDVVNLYLNNAYGIDVPRQLSQSRDAVRQSDLIQVTSAIYQYAAENDGEIPEGITGTPTCMGTSPECVNLKQIVVPTYIAELPKDPLAGTDENTGYLIYAAAGRVTAQARGELEPEIKVTR